MDFESVKGVLLALVCVSVPVIVSGLLYFAKAVVKFIETKSKDIIDSTDNVKLKKYIELIRDNAVIIVNSLNQTVVDDLKKSAEDGKLTEDEIAAIGTVALDKMYGLVSEDVKDTLITAYGDLDELFRNLIEEAIDKVKKNK